MRLSANQLCWPAQEAVEAKVRKAFEDAGVEVVRAHPFDLEKQHGFIDSQKYGMEIFRSIPADAAVVVVESVWQYSHHVLAGLWKHKGPILTVANWSGQWPGLVGMLNLNGGLTKGGIPYSTLWSENFDDQFFLTKLEEWLKTGQINHDTSHVTPFESRKLNEEAQKLGQNLAEKLLSEQAILGVFDEGCMGMYNAIVPDELLHPLGLFKERLSQSALLAEMQTVSDTEAREVYEWLLNEGMTFNFGSDPKTELTEAQVLEQCKMYIASVRMADDFGCEAIGIQYQLGLKDCCSASDLVEGILNNPHRPPVRSRDGSRVLYEGKALTHFNEVDECAGIDGLVTNRLWTELGFDPSNTLHDVRYGEAYEGDFVWVFEISGAAPASHFVGGYRGAVGERQPPMYFPYGGSSMKGVSKPGEVVWSRVYVDKGELWCDIGRLTAKSLPKEETERRWRETTPAWPMMHAVLHGVSRDQLMAKHKSNHIQVVYAPDSAAADFAMEAKAAFMVGLGVRVNFCGV